MLEDVTSAGIPLLVLMSSTGMDINTHQMSNQYYAATHLF